MARPQQVLDFNTASREEWLYAHQFELIAVWEAAEKIENCLDGWDSKAPTGEMWAAHKAAVAKLRGIAMPHEEASDRIPWLDTSYDVESRLQFARAEIRRLQATVEAANQAGIDALVAFQTREHATGVEVHLAGRRGTATVALDQRDLEGIIDHLIEARNERWPDLEPWRRVPNRLPPSPPTREK